MLPSKLCLWESREINQDMHQKTNKHKIVNFRQIHDPRLRMQQRKQKRPLGIKLMALGGPREKPIDCWDVSEESRNRQLSSTSRDLSSSPLEIATHTDVTA